MKPSVSALLATMFAAGLAVAGANAKTLVYCSEGSPEGFDPGLYTSGTTMDASSQAVYNRLVEFVKGTTQVGPGLAQSWDISPDGLAYTFHLRPNVKFQTTSYFTPSRDLNADDVDLHVRAADEEGQPVLHLLGRDLGIFQFDGDA